MLSVVTVACAVSMPGVASGADCAPVKFQLVNAGAEPVRVERIELRGARRDWSLDMKDRRIQGDGIYTTNKLTVDGIEPGESMRVRVRFRRAGSGDTGVRTGKMVEAVCEGNITVRMVLD